MGQATDIKLDDVLGSRGTLTGDLLKIKKYYCYVTLCHSSIHPSIF